MKMEKTRGLNVTLLPPEEKYFKAVPGYMKRIRDLYEAIYERFGEDGLQLIRDVSARYGTELGRHVKKHLDDGGIRGVGAYIVRVFDMVDGDWEITVLNERKMIIEVSRCPYPFKDDNICRAHTCMEKALVETLDPTLEYDIGRSIPQGDPVCEHIIRKKIAS
jgi:hypothetical protein